MNQSTDAQILGKISSVLVHLARNTYRRSNKRIVSDNGKMAGLILLAVGFAIFFAASVFSEARLWVTATPTRLVRALDWRVVYLKGTQPNTGCSLQPVDVQCLASPQNASLWSSPSTRADKSHPEAISKSDVVWFGTQLTTADMDEARRSGALTFRVGYLRGSYQFFLNGYRVGKGQILGKLPALLFLNMSFIEQSSTAYFAIRFVPDKRSAFPDQMFQQRRGEGLVTDDQAAAVGSATMMSTAAWPLALALLYFGMGLLFSQFWWASPKKQEHAAFAGLLLIMAFKQWMQSNMAFELLDSALLKWMFTGILSVLEAGGVLAFAFAFCRIDRAYYLFTAPVIVLLALVPGVLVALGVPARQLSNFAAGISAYVTPCICLLAVGLAATQSHAIHPNAIRRKRRLRLFAVIMVAFFLVWCLDGYAIANPEVVDWINRIAPLALVFFVAVLVISEYREMNQREVERTIAVAMSKMAAQVAHDIRSPLSALDTVAVSIKHLPEDDRIIIRTAVNRIKDIANSLIDKNRELKAVMTGVARSSAAATTLHSSIVEATSNSNELQSVELLSSLLDPLITEKRLQFRSKLSVEIDGRLDGESYGLFAQIQPTEFKRVLSNLINNAVEALDDKGTVTITLGTKTRQIEIRVIDNGKGIPAEVLARLGRRGETYDKPGGSGLGLYHAKTSVASWGGNLSIESEIGKGTIIILSLPRAFAPAWFVSELKLIERAAAVVLDDDSSIHGIWQGRFDSARVTDRGICIVHVSTPDEFRKWVIENPEATKTATYLADFELVGSEETGLDLIRSLNIGGQSILVTSRFEEKSVKSACIRLGVRMIPKSMVGFVPIRIASQAMEAIALDAVLIDDDPLVHMVWKNSAKRTGKTVLCFFALTEFLASSDLVGKSVPIYIDSCLGTDSSGREIRGEEISREIKSLGFATIFLATGLAPAGVERYTWLAGVCGKEPPFDEPGFSGIRGDMATSAAHDASLSSSLVIDETGCARIRTYLHELLKPVQQTAMFLALLGRVDDTHSDLPELLQALITAAKKVPECREMRIEKRAQMSESELSLISDLDRDILSLYLHIEVYTQMDRAKLERLRSSGELSKQTDMIQKKSADIANGFTALAKRLRQK